MYASSSGADCPIKANTIPGLAEGLICHRAEAVSQLDE